MPWHLRPGVIGGNRGAAGSGPASDPNFSSVKLLLGFNGADGANSGAVITDESGSAHGAATIHGDIQADTAQSVFGGSSLLMDGTADWMTWPDSADFNLSNSSFTLECRIRTTTVATGPFFIISQWQATPNLGWAFNLSGSTLRLSISTTGTDNLVDLSGGTLSTNTWYAVCIDFDGTKYRLYVDGTMVGSSTTLRTIHDSSLVLSIGANSLGSFAWNGWIDELRLTLGVARYASDSGYTVATAAFPRS